MLIHIIVCSLYILLLQSLASRCIIYHKYKDDVLFISELLMPNDAQVKYNLQNIIIFIKWSHYKERGSNNAEEKSQKSNLQFYLPTRELTYK